MPEARLKVFVGRSFSPEDERIWVEIRKTLDAFHEVGLVYEDAERAQAKRISKKIRDGIERNQVYLAILPRRSLLYSRGIRDSFLARARDATTSQSRFWSTSEWVIEEVGYALGKDKFVLMMAENGVLFPETDLDADTEWIRFDRDNLQPSHKRLTEIINHLIGKTLPVAVAASPQSQQPAEAKEIAEDASGEEGKFAQLLDFAKKGETEKADKLQLEMLANIEDADVREWESSTLRGFRANLGEVESLQWLKDQASLPNPPKAATSFLARLYRKWGKLDDAVRLLEEHLAKPNIKDRREALLYIAKYYSETGRHDAALAAVREKLALDTTPEQKADSFTEVSEIASASKRDELALSALECAVHLVPLDGHLRFKLAYLYGDKDRHRLSAFHYRILLQQEEGSSGAANNLAIQYGYLDAPDLEIASYSGVANDNPLAKANLSYQYAEAGFLEEAEKLAKEALAAADAQSMSRANAALARIAEMREASSKTAEELLSITREEREFRNLAALAFATPLNATGSFDCAFPYGTLRVIARGGRLFGEIQEPSPESDHMNTLVALMTRGMPGAGAGGSPPKMRTRKFEAQLDGCAGTFTHEVEGPTLMSSSINKGLIMVSADLSSMTLLEVIDNGVAKKHIVSVTPVDAIRAIAK